MIRCCDHVFPALFILSLNHFLPIRFALSGTFKSGRLVAVEKTAPASASKDEIGVFDQSTGVAKWPVLLPPSSRFVDNRQQHEAQLKRTFGSPLVDGTREAGDVANGYGVKLFENGKLYAGDFVGGRRCGRGVQRWPDGHVFIGEWKDDSRLCGEYRFSFGDKDGSGAIEDNECDRYIGEWLCDKMHGRGTFWCLCRLFGVAVRYISCVHVLEGVYYHMDGGVYEGEFADNVMEGSGTFRKPDGSFVRGQ